MQWLISNSICNLYFIVFMIHSLDYMIRFSFVNMDIQKVNNPYKCVFNILIANRRHVTLLHVCSRYIHSYTSLQYTSLTGYSLLKCEK